jgi:hypothetical protein
MSRPVQQPSEVRGTSMPFRLLGLLFLGVMSLWACDLSYPTADWVDQNYDHLALSDGYELEGPHNGEACDGCHATGDMELLYHPVDNQDCIACHTDDYEAEHADDGYPTTCLTCHNGQTWPRSEFDHNTETEFPLNSIHEDFACDKCHWPDTWAPRWNPTSQSDCTGCHG